MSMDVALQPTWIERARSLLASAGVATLSTGCPRTGTTTTPVPLEDRGDGLPVLRLDRTSPAVAGLARCRVATLLVSAPDEEWGLRVHVSLRMQAPDASGVRAYEPTLLSVRTTGPGSRTIPVAAFLRATPLATTTPAGSLLEHLGSAHADDLVAHVWSLGVVAEAVVPLEMHDDAIEVAVLGAAGVARLRIDTSVVCDC